jgi:hypothetical protein
MTWAGAATPPWNPGESTRRQLNAKSRHPVRAPRSHPILGVPCLGQADSSILGWSGLGQRRSLALTAR